MATGLSVDYSVYFAQRFVMITADGTRNGRMVMALADTGSAVFVGGLTALIGGWALLGGAALHAWVGRWVGRPAADETSAGSGGDDEGLPWCVCPVT